MKTRTYHYQHNLQTGKTIVASEYDVKKFGGRDSYTVRAENISAARKMLAMRKTAQDAEALMRPADADTDDLELSNIF